MVSDEKIRSPRETKDIPELLDSRLWETEGQAAAWLLESDLEDGRTIRLSVSKERLVQMARGHLRDLGAQDDLVVHELREIRKGIRDAALLVCSDLRRVYIDRDG